MQYNPPQWGTEILSFSFLEMAEGKWSIQKLQFQSFLFVITYHINHAPYFLLTLTKLTSLSEQTNKKCIIIVAGKASQAKVWTHNEIKRWNSDDKPPVNLIQNNTTLLYEVKYDNLTHNKQIFCCVHHVDSLSSSPFCKVKLKFNGHSSLGIISMPATIRSKHCGPQPNLWWVNAKIWIYIIYK